jgi:hypothetical protein
MKKIYYHGGIAGLEVGDKLTPSPPHQEDGCPVCVARAEGRTLCVWEFLAWAKSRPGAKAKQLVKALEGADPMAPIDPPSAKRAVYVTTDLDYAMFYAARSKGDLYTVSPFGELKPSNEDHFPSWTVPGARIRSVIKRRVRLDRKDRRRIMKRWKKMDSQHIRQA